MQLNTGQLQYIRLAQPVSGTQVVQGQIQTLATNAQQVCAPEMRGLSWGLAGAGFWLERSAQHTTLLSTLFFSKNHLHTCISILHPRDRWGFMEDCIQSVSLTILAWRNKEVQGREVSRIPDESLMYLCVGLTRRSVLTECLLIKLFPALKLMSDCVLAPPVPFGRLA